MKSYYEILEIGELATESEIKKQYRKLVRMYHPDVNSSFEAEEKFKEINRAAEILLDCEKRKNYDSLRRANQNIYQHFEKAKKNNFSKNEFFKKEKEEKKPSKNGEDITLNVAIDLQEALLGTYRSVNIAHSMVCPKCFGRKFANGAKCSFCNGQGEKTIHKKITVKIPPMIKNGAKLRIKGEGKKGENGGLNGNLYVIVNIENKSELNIIDNIVYYEAKISPYFAVLGGNLTVPTLWGEAIIKIPPLTKSNQSFKLIDVGVLDEKTGKKGDEIVKIVIQIPSKMTDEEYRLYEQLQEINNNKKNAKSINS